MKAAYKLPHYDTVLDEAFPVSGKEYILKIKDMPSEQKPREKMTTYGPGALSIPELIAVLLNTGTKKEDVMSMSSRILKEYGEQTLANQTNPQLLSEHVGIPLAKAMQIVACSELGKRFYSKRTTGPQTIRTAKDVFEYLSDMRNLPKEHLRGIYLNTHHRVVHDETISIGTINSNLVHAREVFKPAIEYGAAAVILAHNHPSGITTPSEADMEITRQIVAVGKIIGIPVIDHVIIGGNKFTSVNVDY